MLFNMRNLYVFDVLPFVHAGNVNKWSKLEYLVDTGSRCYSTTIPTGGVSLIFNELYNIVGTGDIVFCSDRTPTIKRDMYSEYKNNREHNDKIRISRDVTEYILKKCGGTVLACHGYEADDFIYTVVRHLHDQYDNIFIYTGDSDLYFLVDEKVSIRPSSSNAKSVNIENYETVIKKGVRTRYNTKTFAKVLCGDASDNVPGVPQAYVDAVVDVMYSDQMIRNLGNRELVRYWVNNLCPELVPQVDLIFPLDAPIDELPDPIPEMDKYMIRNIGASINNKIYRGTGDASFDVSPYSEELYHMGCFLED